MVAYNAPSLIACVVLALLACMPLAGIDRHLEPLSRLLTVLASTATSPYTHVLTRLLTHSYTQMLRAILSLTLER